LEALIRSGGLDRFDERNRLYFNIELILDYHKRQSQEVNTGQFNLFATLSASSDQLRAPLVLRVAPAATQREKLHWEKELLGLYISAHPFDEYRERLHAFCHPIVRLHERKKDKSTRIAGVITLSKKIATKNNEPMVFMKLEDMTADVEVVIFPRVYKEKPEIWEGDRILVVSGRVQEKEGELKFLAESGYEVTPDNIDQIAQYVNGGRPTLQGEGGSDAMSRDVAMSQAQASQRQAVSLYLRAALPDTILLKLRTILDKYPGHYSVYFTVDHPGGRQKVLSSYRIAFNDLIEKELETILGPETVRVEV
jgi:DNA polymerase-3 subunit alpha